MVDRHERSDVRRNREALLKAAAEVLAADPSASMDDIAARAGLGRATMYRHVSGRADLLAELSEWALDSARRAVADEREDPARLVWETVVEGWRPAS